MKSNKANKTNKTDDKKIKTNSLQTFTKYGVNFYVEKPKKTKPGSKPIHWSSKLVPLIPNDDDKKLFAEKSKRKDFDLYQYKLKFFVVETNGFYQSYIPRLRVLSTIYNSLNELLLKTVQEITSRQLGSNQWHVKPL